MTDQQLPNMSPPTMRRTRFVCISDTHNASPGGAFKLPRGDVLVHCGDLTNQGSFSELQKTIKWLEEADFEARIIVAGLYPQHHHKQ
jgi:predicted phosphodiesterase